MKRNMVKLFRQYGCGKARVVDRVALCTLLFGAETPQEKLRRILDALRWHAEKEW